MRKMILLLALASGAAAANAGGILTNSNQSAQYVRMLSRNASTEMDAVYYNPAGLTLLKDGFHLSFNNQFLFQKRTIENDYPYLNNNSYAGDVTTPIFPTFLPLTKKTTGQSLQASDLPEVEEKQPSTTDFLRSRLKLPTYLFC